MQKSFTKNTIVKFLYRETSAAEDMAIRELEMSDYSFREELNGLRQAYRQLPKVGFRPRQSTLDQVVGYSRKALLQGQL